MSGSTRRRLSDTIPGRQVTRRCQTPLPFAGADRTGLVDVSTRTGPGPSAHEPTAHSRPCRYRRRARRPAGADHRVAHPRRPRRRPARPTAGRPVDRRLHPPGRHHPRRHRPHRLGPKSRQARRPRRGSGGDPGARRRRRGCRPRPPRPVPAGPRRRPAPCDAGRLLLAAAPSRPHRPGVHPRRAAAPAPPRAACSPSCQPPPSPGRARLS
jgi:hypothetical protein